MVFKIKLITLLLFLFAHAHAQIKRGTMLLGEDLSFSGTIDKQKSFSINTKTSLGFFIRNNLVTGLIPGFSYSNSKPFDSHRYSLSPFIRVYRNFLYPRVYLFAEVLFNLSEERFRSGVVSSPDMHQKKTAGVGILPGINLFLTNRVSAEVIFDVAAFNAYFDKKKDFMGAETNINTQDYRFNFNLQNITVGLQFFLGREKIF